MSDGGASPAKAPGRGWQLNSDPAETVVANARLAFFVMVGVLIVLWAIQIANWADGYRLTDTYAIEPRNLASLPHILTAPFLHLSWSHIEGNSGPLFIFGFLAAYRGIRKFIGLTVIVVVTSGMAAWLFANAGGAGASGVVFGYFGYIMVRGFFDRHAIDMIIGAVMGLCFAYQFTVLVPQPGIGWQAHIGGLLGGIIAGWLLRERHGARSASAVKASSATPAATVAEASPSAIWSKAAPATARHRQRKDSGKAAASKDKDLAVDPANPRAELYKQLDDMGL